MEISDVQQCDLDLSKFYQFMIVMFWQVILRKTTKFTVTETLNGLHNIYKVPL